MTTHHQLVSILNRIARGEQTTADIEALQQVLNSEKGLESLQLGKYNINIDQGQNIHIGDHIFVDWNEEALQALVKVLQKQLPQPQPIGIPENLPRSGVVKFVGRDRDLERLHQQLQDSARVAVSAIAGMGGVGKTELALQYASKYKQYYPAGICWLQARGVDLGAQIIEFAQSQLGLNPPEYLKDLAGQVRYCWRYWPLGETLVVFDDVTDYDAIKSYLPPVEPRLKVLITTRRRLGQSIKQLEIDILDEPAALALVESLVGSERIQPQIESLKQLCDWLGYLPLGLELAGRYLARKPTLSISELLERLKAKGLEERSLQRTRTDDDMTGRLGVAAAFELSWNELAPLAQEICYLLSIFSLVPIPWPLVERCFCDHEPEELEEVRDDFLLDLHLLQDVRGRIKNPYPTVLEVMQSRDSFKLHELIREFMQIKLLESIQFDDLENSISAKFVAILEKDPVCASEILNKGFLDWDLPQDPDQSSAIKFGQRYRSSMQAWVDSIGPLAQLIAPLRKDGKLPVFGARLDETSRENSPLFPKYPGQVTFCASWYFGDDISEDVIELPLGEARELIARGWNGLHTEIQLRQQASAIWRLTHNHLIYTLNSLIKSCRLPVDMGSLLDEGAWRAAYVLVGRRDNSGIADPRPIPIHKIEHHLAQDKYDGRIERVCLQQLHLKLDYLHKVGAQALHYPWSHKNSSSPEDLCTEVTRIYREAIQTYQYIIDTWFPRFASNLKTASLLPARITGVVIPPNSRQQHALASWHWDVLPPDRQSDVHFVISNKPISSDDPVWRAAYERLRTLRPQRSKRFPGMGRFQWLPQNHFYPVTDIVYSWLWQDLEETKWVRGSRSESFFCRSI